MFLVGILEWWYTDGWQRRARIIKEHVASTADFFSLDILIRTLFSPFRQISAGRVVGPLEVQLRAFFDKLISRIIGAMVRLFMLIIGAVAIILHAVIGATILVGWLFLPVLPVVGILLFIIGALLPWGL